ncbi:hypothetical protein NE237_030908 [Protea cynaroides]|uniref:SAM domain-containing protein n=1 Tax=Protea cynaroides TaxID=273540 RepID=A0A9Q0JW85_9MAGN|nr:hypothetical protein NE237_030908 [Protea cynaroides]
MDWFSWLSKTELEPSLVYEYGLAFAHNELEEEDIVYFNHEFLQSMGISIAKHRLEILKLARREKGGKLHPLSKLISAVKKTKRSLANYIHTWVHRNDSALVVVSKPNYSKRWKGAMLKRNKRLMSFKQERLMLTNGSPKVSSGPLNGSPMVYQIHNDDHKVDDDTYWTSAVQEIRWDAMFQDLKPT